MHELCVLELADMLFDGFLKTCLAPFASNRRFICGSIGKACRPACLFKRCSIRFGLLAKLRCISRVALGLRTSGGQRRLRDLVCLPRLLEGCLEILCMLRSSLCGSCNRRKADTALCILRQAVRQVFTRRRELSCERRRCCGGSR